MRGRFRVEPEGGLEGVQPELAFLELLEELATPAAANQKDTLALLQREHADDRRVASVQPPSRWARARVMHARARTFQAPPGAACGVPARSRIVLTLGRPRTGCSHKGATSPRSWAGRGPHAVTPLSTWSMRLLQAGPLPAVR